MADIKQDLLGLEYSASFTLQGIQEADINLELPPVSGGSATVYGTVTDGTDPLADATVKLFDSTGAPFQHTLTDASGQYSMSGIPAGTYTIAAVKDGYRLSGALGVTLAASDTTQMNLTCTGGRHADPGRHRRHHHHPCGDGADSHGGGQDHPEGQQRRGGGIHLLGRRRRVPVLRRG